jgi:hypothetical protein
MRERMGKTAKVVNIAKLIRIREREKRKGEISENKCSAMPCALCC